MEITDASYNRSVMRRSSKVILPVLIILVLGISGFSSWIIYQLIATIHYQSRSLAIQTQLNHLNSLLQNMEAAAQANLLLGDLQYRVVDSESVEKIPQRLKELKALVKSDPKQFETFKQVENFVLERIQMLSDQMDPTSYGRNQVLESLKAVKRNLLLSHLIQKGFQEMDVRESMELNGHEKKVKLYSESAIQLIGVGTFLTLALVLMFAWMSYSEIRRRNRLLEELGQAREAATVASRLKSHFLATVSHEIRTPLNGIIGFSELLRNRLTDVEQKNMVALIHQSGLNLLKIVNDILDFSKIEAGKIAFEISDFSLSQVVAGVVELLSIRARQKGLFVQTYIDPKIPSLLRGDSARISQVLQNFLSNALKFTDNGGVLVSLHIRGRSAAGEAILRLEVQDSGPGISQDDQKILFQPFNQLKRSEGTGLGLSICKSLVEQMNGRIGVVSAVGDGALFWAEFTLPVATKEEMNGTKESTRETPPVRHLTLLTQSQLLGRAFEWVCRDASIELLILKELPVVGGESQVVFVDAMTIPSLQIDELVSRGAGIAMVAPSWYSLENTKRPILRLPFAPAQLMAVAGRVMHPVEPGINVAPITTQSKVQEGVVAERGVVLLVEDNPVNQALAEMHLNRQGFRVQSVGDGKEAVDAVRSIEYDLVLMDIQMPVMDGLQATELIRQNEMSTGRHIPIIAMTANAMPGDRERFLSAGMDGYIAKPFQESDLDELLEEFAPDRSDPVDWTVLENLAQKTSAETVVKLRSSYLNSLQKALVEIQGAQAAQNWQKIQFVAHSLKASSEALGAIRLSRLCRDLEEAVRGQEDSGKLNALCTRLLNDLYAVQSALQVGMTSR